MRLLRLVVAALGCAVVCFGQGATLLSVKKIWDQGEHNAFTDLIRHQDKWFCTFREAGDHVSPGGKIRVIVSDDGERWESAALLADAGFDLRDPKISRTPDGRLMLLIGVAVKPSGGKSNFHSRVAFSKDGRRWGPWERVVGPGEWLWRVSWRGEKGYGVTYRGVGGNVDKGVLYQTAYGVTYKRIKELDVPCINETAIRFRPGGEAIMLGRCDDGEHAGWIGTSRPPYRDWKWHRMTKRPGGPDFSLLPNGRMWAGSRKYLDDGSRRTVLWRMTPTSYEPVLEFPSGGDTSYPGMVYHEGVMWFSYYSSHEGKTSIYLAKVRLEG